MTWKDITIEKYQKLYAIRNGVYEFEIEREIEILSLLTGEPVDVLEQLPKTELVAMAHETDFVNKPLSEKLTTSVRVGVRRYNVTVEANKLCAEQFILLNKYTATEQSVIDNLHFIFATITNERRVFNTHAWDKDFEAKAELFKRLPIETVYATCVFFCKVYKSWLEATETYLIQRAQELQAKAKNMKR